MHWITKAFGDLTLQEWHDLVRLRIDVFVVEQNCAYPELDGLDTAAMHLFAQEQGAIVAYARVLPPGADGVPHIGRVVVRKDNRGNGIASELMQHALDLVKARYGTFRSALAAQTHLEHFYAKLGFERVGPDYPLDGIPHVDMVRTT